MNRQTLSILLFLAGLLLNGYSTLLTHALFTASLIVSAQDLYKWVVYLFYGGCPLSPLKCLENACYSDEQARRCGYLGFEVLDCRHGCYDLDEREYWARSLTLMSVAFTSGGEYIFVVKQGKMFIIAKRCASSHGDVVSELLRAREVLERGLELAGCSARRLKAVEVKNILRPDFLKTAKVNMLRVFGTVALTAALATRFPPLYVLLGLELVALSDLRSEIYTVSQEGRERVYGLNESTVTFTYPSLRDVFTRARTNYLIAQSLSYLAVKLEPAPWDVASGLDAQAYRSYEFGTALDKLSIIHKSQKYFLASRRKWERREPVFLATGLLMATPETAHVYERMGLRFKPDIFALKTLE
ncbi:hypothetical protein IG193_04140 [Infirmifilum lucidum]|uniref:Uncharacterized protein n=1 Tax=Infirmifilum lucidum TaxID=2776706 RepID=A0A7L9FJV5_9CREN|nr:hypothetical protein [Infirmifilum lucidum]QOJ79652.1 hypothetical protein IG193_04140 [Infirmifilum lucidum]